MQQNAALLKRTFRELATPCANLSARLHQHHAFDKALLHCLAVVAATLKHCTFKKWDRPASSPDTPPPVASPQCAIDRTSSVAVPFADIFS